MKRYRQFYEKSLIDDLNMTFFYLLFKGHNGCKRGVFPFDFSRPNWGLPTCKSVSYRNWSWLFEENKNNFSKRQKFSWERPFQCTFWQFQISLSHKSAQTMLWFVAKKRTVSDSSSKFMCLSRFLKSDIWNSWQTDNYFFSLSLKNFNFYCL